MHAQAVDTRPSSPPTRPGYEATTLPAPMAVTPLYCMLLTQLLLVYAYANIAPQDVKGRCTSSINNS